MAGIEGRVAFKEKITVDDLSDAAAAILNELAYNDNLNVDLTGVTEMDIAAIQVFLAAKKECGARGKRIVFSLSGEVKGLLSATGLDL